MSPLSFKLSKKGKSWHATGKIPGAKSSFDIECGDGSEQSARKMANYMLERRAQLVEASRMRWRKFHAEREAAKAKASTAPPAEPDDVDDEEPDDVDDEELDEQEEEQPTPSDRPPAPSPNAEKIRAKLLAIGDSSVDPDDVIPPGGNREPDDDDEDPVDEETGQLVAEVLAGVAVNWHTRTIAKRLKKRKPPKRPGEADDRMLAWEHDGIAYNLAKLVGKAVALGPTGKMLVGISVVTAQMYLDAEEIEGGQAEAAAPRAPAEEPRGNANGKPTNTAAGETETKPGAQLSLVRKPNPGVGRFK